MDDKKEMLIRLPEDLFSVMKDFKNVSGISYTNQIYSAVVWYYFQKGLLDLGWIKDKHAKNGNGKKKEVNKIEVMDESLKFCDGDKCEMPILPMKSC
jgi:hypothetical protein